MEALDCKTRRACVRFRDSGSGGLQREGDFILYIDERESSCKILERIMKIPQMGREGSLKSSIKWV